MKHNFFLAVLLLGLINSCSPKLKTVILNERPTLAYDNEVFVVNINEQLPKGVKVVGKLAIKDSGFTTKCTYEMVLEQAKLEARTNGANIVKIIEHKTPSALGSSCHRLKVVFYYLKDTTGLANIEEEPILEGIDYAILHVYRYSGMGPMVGYNLQLGDSTICRVKNSFKEVIQIKKDGLNTLWAKTESKVQVPIDVVFGKSYYLRCGIKMGALVGRPTLELVDYQTGKAEFENFEAKNSTNEQ
jgi:hypothetical protein